jgi:hypothetical protein
MIGRTVLHYKIVAPLGSGGMGVVYLAEDERLGRQVALKFLPASWLQEPVALERFRVEARAASALSHPGICTIYDIGNDGDSPFIVMEALKGETLRERIARGALRVQEILEIGVQLTDALDAAHSRGIVHRDIKPANIFLGEKNRLKVLDFGLAKLGATSSGPSSLTDTTTAAMLRAHQAQMTTPGTAVGTVSYMSPEQARGDDVDTRTDLFSVGAVLYEMATGVQAFGGNSVAVTFDGILNRTPKPISQLNPLIPSQVEAVVAKALEKDRELRYQHASDLHAELKRIRRDFEAATFVTSPPALTAARGAAAAATATQSQVSIPSRGRWYKTAAVATLVIVTVGIWAWVERRGSEESAGTAVVVENAVIPEAPAETPGAAAPSAPPAVTAPAPGRTVEPADAQPAPARSERPQPSQPVETLRQGLRPPPTPAGGAPTPEQSTPSPPTNTATVQAPTVPSAAAAEPPASTGTARDNAPQPNQTPPSTVTTSAPAAESRAAATPSVPTPVPQKPDTSVSSPAKPSVVPTDDEAAIRSVLRSYEQAIETKDIGLYRSIRPRLTATEEALLRNSFRQVDSQEVTIRVESLNIDGRVATVRIFRQDTLVTGGRRQVQNTTQTLQFEKTAAGWVIN